MKRIPKGQSRIDKPEKPTIYGTQDEANTICVGHHYAQKTHNVVRNMPCHKFGSELKPSRKLFQIFND